MKPHVLSPLRRWKVEYAYVSETIRLLKTLTRSRGDIGWGQFKKPKQQCALKIYKQEAQRLMTTRNDARDEARALYQNNHKRHNQKKVA